MLRQAQNDPRGEATSLRSLGRSPCLQLVRCQLMDCGQCMDDLQQIGEFIGVIACDILARLLKQLGAQQSRVLLRTSHARRSLLSGALDDLGYSVADELLPSATFLGAMHCSTVSPVQGLDPLHGDRRCLNQLGTKLGGVGLGKGLIELFGEYMTPCQMSALPRRTALPLGLLRALDKLRSASVGKVLNAPH